MRKHKSDYVVEDIIGGFKIWFVSTILIYLALAVINTLSSNFPIKEDSWWFISISVGLLLAFGNYVKDKNKKYFGR